MLRRRLVGIAVLACVACQWSTHGPAVEPPPPPPVAYTTPQYSAPGEPGRPPRERARPRLHPAPNGAGALDDRYANVPATARFRGIASYYSHALAGRPTASGEPYDPRLLTAAHRSLPFGSVVRVIREDGRGMVYVRINDRGPFVRGRVLDLSRAAAENLGIIQHGLMKVRVELVERGPEAPRGGRSPRRSRRQRPDR